MRKRRATAVTGYLQRARQFIEERPAEGAPARPLIARLRTACQFLYLVWQGFADNRCPIRAAALSYTTLLAFVPLLAVVLSVATNFLHERSVDLVPKLLDKMVSIVAPQLQYMPLPEDTLGPPAPGQPIVSTRARQEAVEKIQSFVENIHSGALGVIGSIFLVFVGIRLLTTIEATFNDIWGVREGRTIWRKIVYYWSTITLGPLLLLLAMYMTGRAEFSSLIGKFGIVPGLQNFLFRLAPFVLLWIGFSFMYGLLPNTRVRPHAALIGGVVAGTLWQCNNLLSAMYLSRVVTYSKIYGTLGIVPVFLVGLYFSWLIVLFGAQVSFAAQTIRTYLQQRASETFDQLGRELIACRIVLGTCHSFLRGSNPPTQEALSEQFRAPLQLLNRLVARLVEGGVLSEVAGEQGGLRPARPPESITVADVLHVVRTNNGTCGESTARDRGEPVADLLSDLYAAERGAAANADFGSLAAQLSSGTF